MPRARVARLVAAGAAAAAMATAAGFGLDIDQVAVAENVLGIHRLLQACRW